MPKWVKPERQAYLVKLFTNSGGFCVYGHRPCNNPSHHYDLYIECVIKNWIDDDRLDRLTLEKIEIDYLHRTNDRKYPITGTFSGIARDIWHDKQPELYIDSLGMSGLTLTPFAKVRISGSYMRLYVDLGNTLRQLSKNKRRKLIRYQQPLPEHIERQIRELCLEAYNHYMTH